VRLTAVPGPFVLFFFQAEDGIRDYKVTGVQTCALPISSASLTDDNLLRHTRSKGKPIILSTGMSTLEQIDRAVEVLGKQGLILRSEERRVGKECRSGGWPDDEKKKKERDGVGGGAA